MMTTLIAPLSDRLAALKASCAGWPYPPYLPFPRDDTSLCGGETRTTQQMEQSESRMDKIKRRWAVYVIGLLVVIAAAAWWMLRPPGLPAGFASSNGRIEATEVDIATKTAGRIDTILVKEGQFVRRGEVLARMDIRVLNEQRLEAAAQIKEAESSIAAAKALLDQRQGEMRAAEAVVKQRQAELNSAAKRYGRSSTLTARRGLRSAA